MKSLSAVCYVVMSVLVACGSSPAGADTDAMGSWQLATGTVQGEPIPIVPGYRITLTIERDSAGGRSACNWYGQTIRIEGDSLTLGEGSSTAIGCRPDVMASEEAYLTGLRRSDTIVRDGEAVVVSGPHSSLRFERLPPVPEAALLDTVWVLDQQIDGEQATPAEGEPATLELRSDSTFTGSTGCRGLTGTFVIRGDEILATRMSADGRCPADLADQDGHVVGVLGDGFTVAIEGDRLTVTATGNVGLSYRAT